MGEVYRARDAKLGRDVALKILSSAMAHDSQLLARLEREARTLASLNHPNIAAIYGLEEAEGLRALVMELVEGETLAEHIRGAAGGGAKPLPAEEALPMATQIAEALEYAHERGVIHRDLKPANVKITPEGTVKVLDFGLAKVLSDQDSMAPAIPANSPTLSAMATQAGIILGTAAYMAPEQAKGKPVDRRADIWAFGCVLFEMMSGRKAFEGETISDLLAAVIRGEPEWTALPETTPPAIQRLIRRCLQKDVRQRLQAIGDARIAIEETLSGADTEAAAGGGPTAERGRRSLLRRALPWALGAATILFAAFASWLLLKPKPQPNVIRFPVAPPDNAEFITGGEMSISPDGHYLAFIAQAGSDKPPVLWLRPLDSMTAEPIPGTEGATMPFWSPDSQQIGFEANGKLEKIAVSGGAQQTLCSADTPGGSWNRDGVILFGNHRSLFSVPDTGGAPTLVAAPDAARNEAGFEFPQFLPDGRRFLVEVATPGTQPNFIGVGSLDSKTVKHLVQITSDAFYAPPGYVFYSDQGTLMARPFSVRALDFTGPAVPVAQSVGSYGDGFYGFFTVSPAGVLAYQTAAATTTNQMAWFSRTGQKVGTVGEPGVYATPALSRDGAKLAVGAGDQAKRNIWVYDLKRGTGSRLTFSAADDVNPIWSLDGSHILFSSNRDGQYDIYQQAADGLGSTQPVFQLKDEAKYLNDLTADGRYAIYDTGTSANTTQLWGLPLFGDRKPFIFVQGAFGATSAQFSPNGRYLAYASNETGRNEIYVQTFPEHTGKWQISASGGTEPTWRSDGKELFYLTLDEKLMAVDVNTESPSFQAGIPKPLFQAQLVPLSYWRNIYVPSPDGQRFLMLVPANETKAPPITVVVNWPALLKGSSK
jgi:Tol biopolymer transport system component/tRNA A-37 threonylcarbamoyl transferase component Bud32